MSPVTKRNAKELAKLEAREGAKRELGSRVDISDIGGSYWFWVDDETRAEADRLTPWAKGVETYVSRQMKNNNMALG